MDKMLPEKSILEETCQAMDCLRDRMGTNHFVLIGMCSGAAVSFRVASVENRVKGIVLINLQVPRTNESEEIGSSQYYWTRALFKPTSWLKFIILRANYRSIWRAVILRFRTLLFPGFTEKSELKEVVYELKNSFRSLKERGVRLKIVSSGADIGEKYLREVINKEYKNMRDSGLLHSETILNTDHNITPLESQKKLIEIITNWLMENFDQSDGDKYLI
jgi:pimeloyl-ACP methyl ester carboxylesterase